ncbi:family 20 glycosylhydrolase [Microbacterium algeriense]|uniref:family 20 glycosylhydrolase n=1 Tax=Microbacterium algeriense TaxID=2615184 RepID=UPI00037A8616|nr:MULTISPECIES: family 20 glycosylhydrolase [Microbacterium]
MSHPPVLPLVPLPQSFVATGGRRPFSPQTVRVTAGEGLESAAAWLSKELDRLSESSAHTEASELVVDLAIGAAPEAIAVADGIDPAGTTADERHVIELDEDSVRVTGPTPRAVLRGVATLLQLFAAESPTLPLGRIEDGPRYRWRGLMLDAVRHPFTIEEIDRVVELIARYKLNVLHVHLTDSQGWRLASPRHPLLEGEALGDVITAAGWDALTVRAEQRGVTILPEIDLPGHAAAVMRAYPALAADTRAARLGYLDPGTDGVREFIETEVAELAERSASPFVHIGGDEPFGMPDDAFADAVTIAVDAAHRSGKRVIAWQEAGRAGAFGQGDVVQYWIGSEHGVDADAKKAELPPEAHRFVDVMVEMFAKAPGDLPLAAASGRQVLISSSDVLYLDRRYAEPAATAAGEERRRRLGFPDYPEKTLRTMHEWTPEGLLDGYEVEVAGVEAALWTESVTGFDDLAFLLLPRLGSVAERAWLPAVTEWEDYDMRIAGHRGWWDRLGWGAAFQARPSDTTGEETR